MFEKVHFILLFLYKQKSRKPILILLYLLTGGLLFLNFSPWFLTASFREQFGFFVTQPKQVYIFHVIVFDYRIIQR